MAQESDDLFECHIRLLFFEDLLDNAGSLFELLILLLVHFDVVVSLLPVNRGWDQQHGNTVNPVQLHLALNENEDQSSENVESWSRRP